MKYAQVCNGSGGGGSKKRNEILEVNAKIVLFTVKVEGLAAVNVRSLRLPSHKLTTTSHPPAVAKIDWRGRNFFVLNWSNESGDWVCLFHAQQNDWKVNFF